MRFLKTIRLDNSDLHVYEHAAAPGEWAVSGTFAFADLSEADLVGKTRQAFTNGFLGTQSFGWSTVVCVTDIGDADYQAVVDALADHFLTAFGAPNRTAALEKARQEAAFAAGLCEHPVNTLLAVRRDLRADGIYERYRIVQPPSDPRHAKIWEIVED